MAVLLFLNSSDKYFQHVGLFFFIFSITKVKNEKQGDYQSKTQYVIYSIA